MLPGARHQLIRAALCVRGCSFAKLAAELNMSSSTISNVSAGRTRSEKVERAIAAKLNWHPGEIWPEHYPRSAALMERGSENAR